MQLTGLAARRRGRARGARSGWEARGWEVRDLQELGWEALGSKGPGSEAPDWPEGSWGAQHLAGGDWKEEGLRVQGWEARGLGVWGSEARGLRAQGWGARGSEARGLEEPDSEAQALVALGWEGSWGDEAHTRACRGEPLAAAGRHSHRPSCQRCHSPSPMRSWGCCRNRCAGWKCRRACPCSPSRQCCCNACLHTRKGEGCSTRAPQHQHHTSGIAQGTSGRLRAPRTTFKGTDLTHQASRQPTHSTK